MKAAVLGGGSWGTALASVLASKAHEVTVWAYESDVASDINARQENGRYLPGIALPGSLRATSDLGAALSGAEMVVARRADRSALLPGQLAEPNLGGHVAKTRVAPVPPVRQGC